MQPAYSHLVTGFIKHFIMMNAVVKSCRVTPEIGLTLINPRTTAGVLITFAKSANGIHNPFTL